MLPYAAGILSLDAMPAKVSFGLGQDSGFETKTTPSPAINDAATQAGFKVIAGTADPNGASLAALHDGKIPRQDDEPGANFFFSGGGRVRVDLEKPTEISAIATYSWHPGARSAQVYEVYAASGTEQGLAQEPPAGVDPKEAGWTLIAKVDTSGNKPGQHGVSITPGSGVTFSTLSRGSCGGVYPSITTGLSRCAAVASTADTHSR